MATYACLPGYDGGREFIIVTSTHASSLGAANRVTEKTFNSVVPVLAPRFAEWRPAAPTP
jgi:hypothetical protein